MMRPDLRQRGFAAIAAIFLVVGLASLGAFMLTLSNTQQLTSAQDVQGTRAYWAARGGLEWALVAIPASPALCADPVVGSVPSSLDGFAIQVRCRYADYSEGASTLRIYQIESRANLGSAPGVIGYIERSVSASVER